MKTPWELLKESKTKIKTTWRIAFVSALVLGLLIHLPVMLSDIPNHDGLSSMYFDQNMITSGRWFLTVACGFSSYFTIPWVIGLIGLIWLALTAAVLTEVLELTDPVTITVVSGLLVSFPALASTFAYVFTMDGYMLALFLAVLAVLFTAKYPRGYLPVQCVWHSAWESIRRTCLLRSCCVYIRSCSILWRKKAGKKRRNMYAIIWGWELPAEYCIM